MAARNTDPRATTRAPHPYDYHYRPGLELRPAPPRIVASPDWLAARRRLLSPWREVKPVPDRTPYLAMLEDHVWEGDAVMDPVVDLSVRIGARRVRSMLDLALDDGIEAVTDPPVELVDLFTQLDRTPPWFDRDLAERGRVVLGNASLYGKSCGMVLEAMLTAMGVPVSSAAGATGMFLRNAARRLHESDKYFHAVSRPGIFDRFDEAFKTNVRVRLMHSQARYGLKYRWGIEHFAHHGSPISNTDMAAGQAGFGLTPLLYDIAQGARHPVADLEAALMYWAYIGYVFGIAEEVRPKNVSEAIELLDFSLAGQGEPTRWSDEVSGAMVGLIRTTLTGTGEGRASHALQNVAPAVVGAFAHHVIGDPLADRLLGNGTGHSRRSVCAMSTLIRHVAGPALGARGLLERRPGREERRRRRVADGDPFMRVRYQRARAVAESQGDPDVSYDTHDASVAR